MHDYVPGSHPFTVSEPAIWHRLAEHAQSLKSRFLSMEHAAAVFATGSFAAATHAAYKALAASVFLISELHHPG